MLTTVGVVGKSYMIERYTNFPFEDTRIVRTYDVASLVNFVRHAYRKTPTSAVDFFNGIHCDLGLNRADLLHHFNKLSFASSPWVVTYEHFLPRWNRNSAWGMRLMASPRCRRIIAMSRWAHTDQMARLNNFPDLKDAIAEKMTVLHPCQRTPFREYPERPSNVGGFRFALVGRDFFLKGGMEVLRTFERLTTEGYPIHLTLVSPLWHGDYITQSTPEDVEAARALIGKLKHCVTHHERLDNRGVLRLFAESDVSLLPTYNDTYGYVVLESQSAGCPVLSTDSCALPEINTDETGWLIDVPKDEHGIALYRTALQRKHLSRSIEEGLYAAIKRICDDPSALRAKGMAAFRRIQEQHNPILIARAQEEIYRDALAIPRTRTMVPTEEELLQR